jgi:recombination protein RecA
VPKAELEGDMEQVTMGTQARLMSKALRKITASISRTNCIVIFINQIRMKIGGYGNPETTTGGNALKFYASVRLEIRRGKSIMKGDEAIGAETTVKVVKNKVAPPFKKVDIELLFGVGISKLGEILTLAEKAGIIIKSGSWYSYNDTRIGQGRENARQYLIDNTKIAEEMEKKIRDKASAISLDSNDAEDAIIAADQDAIKESDLEEAA